MPPSSNQLSSIVARTALPALITHHSERNTDPSPHERMPRRCRAATGDLVLPLRSLRSRRGMSHLRGSSLPGGLSGPLCLYLALRHSTAPSCARLILNAPLRTDRPINGTL